MTHHQAGEGATHWEGCGCAAPFNDGDLKRLKFALENHAPNWIDKDNLCGLLARLEAAEFCVSCLDANFESIEENTDEDDVALVEQGLKAWRKAAGK